MGTLCLPTQAVAHQICDEPIQGASRCSLELWLANARANKREDGFQAVDKVVFIDFSSIRHMNRKRRMDYSCNNRKA